MLKKTMAIGLMCFSMMVLLQAEATAWNVQGGGWGWGSYYGFFVITGGQQPGTLTTFVGTSAAVTQASLACVNPGSKQVDVRKGKGGLTIVTFSNLGDQNEVYDQRGKFELTTETICATATILDPSTGAVIREGECSSDEFNGIWGVDSTDCRNANWVPYQFLIQKVDVTGNVLTDCIITVDENGIPQLVLDQDGNPQCNSSASGTFNCETLEDTRTLWPGNDGIVAYVCNRLN